MTPLDDLAFFQQVARSGSLTGASRELGLSLSAVSKRVMQLEARLDVSLATRTTRRLTLTAEGERYLARGATILSDLGELESELRDRRGDLSGRLRINATFGFGRRHVAPLIATFTERHPGVDIWLELTNFPLSLADHGFDLGIRVGEPPDAHLVAHPILANRRILCASPDYLRRAPSLQRPEDLARHTCLVVRENDSDFALWRFERQGEVRSVRVGGHLASNDGEVVTCLAREGAGILLRSWWDVHAALSQGELVPLLPEWQGLRADFYAVHEPRRHAGARLRTFVEHLAQGMRGRVPELPDASR
ncbi:LysR substrate-binding domain-containing protein [Chromohalobacter sp. 11-W]|uniref:LysR substrate-binding domain-containing protein n=1 Tax=Chromohalobacter sp. 11-W TaxID=2994061 RepID=UPI0024683FD9|nr:LysR substrate-binding domain-containing protein [Chromohalobacter sp. 11-W]